MTWLSEDTAPKCCSSSISVSAIKESGTAWPSLNRNGRRSSYLRSVLLIRGRSFDVEWDALQGQGRERLRRDDHFPGGETLEREATGQVAQGPVLRRCVRKANADHGAHSSAGGS